MWTRWILKVIIFPLGAATLKLRIKCVVRPRQARRHSPHVFCVLATFLASLFDFPTFDFLSDAPRWLWGGGGKMVIISVNSVHFSVEPGRAQVVFVLDYCFFGCKITAFLYLHSRQCANYFTYWLANNSAKEVTDSIFIDDVAEARESFRGPPSW